MGELTIQVIECIEDYEERDKVAMTFEENVIDLLYDKLAESRTGVMDEIHDEAFIRGFIIGLSLALDGDPNNVMTVDNCVKNAQVMSYMSRYSFKVTAQDIVIDHLREKAGEKPCQ